MGWLPKTRATWFVVMATSMLLVMAKLAAYVSFSWIEIIGFVTGLISVWLVVLESHWNWPIGNANSAAFLWLFFTNRLFANSALQVVFICLGFWGWYLWLKKGPQADTRPITKAERSILLGSLVVTIVAVWPIQRLLIAVDGSAPFWDTLTMVMSIVATYLLAKKYLQNWYFWIVADIIYIALFYSRGLYLTSILYVFLLALATSGLIVWQRQYATKEQNNVAVRDCDREVLSVSQGS